MLLAYTDLHRKQGHYHRFKAVALAHSLEIQSQTNIDPNTKDEHMDLVEDLREEEPDDNELINETNSDEDWAIIYKALSQGKP